MPEFRAYSILIKLLSVALGVSKSFSLICYSVSNFSDRFVVVSKDCRSNLAWRSMLVVGRGEPDAEELLISLDSLGCCSWSITKISICFDYWL